MSENRNVKDIENTENVENVENVTEDPILVSSDSDMDFGDFTPDELSMIYSVIDELESGPSTSTNN